VQELQIGGTSALIQSLRPLAHCWLAGEGPLL
jgi:hypothetical protein